jgi:hypothetical protein
MKPTTPVERVREYEDGDGDGDSTTTGPIRVPVSNTPDNNTSPASKCASRSCSTLRNPEDNWLIEIICVVAGSACLAALCPVLHHYDGKATPHFGSAFGSSLTLNTLVAIIAAVAKLLLLFPVAECIGQLRWIWFSRGYRQLGDFATWDYAARGSVWSGFELIWTTRMGSVASVGAVITLFAVAIDPLSQQLIAYRDSSVQSAGLKATIPTTKEFLELTTSVEGVITSTEDYSDLLQLAQSPSEYAYISVGMKRAIRAGLDNGKNKVLDLPAACPSGNCTFEAYSSLAVCMSFADVTGNLYSEDANGQGGYGTQLHLTDDHYLTKNALFLQEILDVGSVAPASEIVETEGRPAVFLNFSQSIAFKDIESPLADIFIITRNGSTSLAPEEGLGDVAFTYAAFEVALSWCVATYNTAVTNGTSNTNMVSNDKNFTYLSGPNALVNEAAQDQYLQDSSVDGKHHAGLQWFFKRLFAGRISQDGTDQTTTTSDVAQTIYEPFSGINFTSPIGNLSRTLRATERDGLQRIFENVAVSMTNYIRLGDENTDSSDPDYKPSAVAIGTVFEPLTVVHIRWPWIAAHACFALFSAGLLVTTILCHRASPLRGQEPWKSSGVAILHSLEPDLQRDLRGVAKMSELQGRAREHRVRLENGGEGWRLVSMGKEVG